MSIELNATLRTNQGKGASRRLRHNNQVPAILYGDKKEPTNLMIQFKEINHLLSFNEEIYSSVLQLNIEKTKEKVILKDLQRHPAKNIVTHIDFQRVNMKVEITTAVPLNIIGEADNDAIRFGAIVNKFVDVVEISCLPKDLPVGIDVDISKLTIGESLSLTDLVVAKSIKINALNHEDIETYNQTVVAVSTPKIEQEPILDDIALESEDTDLESESKSESEDTTPKSEEPKK